MATRFTYIGDKEYARSLKSVGARELAQLQHDMRFQNLTQGQRRLELHDGTIVLTSSVAGYDHITITTPVLQEEKVLKLQEVLAENARVFYVRTTVGDYWVSNSLDVTVDTVYNEDGTIVSTGLEDALYGDSIVLIPMTVPALEVGSLARAYIHSDSRYVFSINTVLIFKDYELYYEGTGECSQANYVGFIFTGDTVLWYSISSNMYSFFILESVYTTPVGYPISNIVTPPHTQDWLLPGNIQLDASTINFTTINPADSGAITTFHVSRTTGSIISGDTTNGGIIQYVFFNSSGIEQYQQNQSTEITDYTDYTYEANYEDHYECSGPPCYSSGDAGACFTWTTRNWSWANGLGITAVNDSYMYGTTKHITDISCQAGSTAAGEANNEGCNSFCGYYAYAEGYSLDDTKPSYTIFCSNMIYENKLERICNEDYEAYTADPHWGNYNSDMQFQCDPETQHSSGSAQMLVWCQLWGGGQWVYHTIHPDRTVSLADFNLDFELNPLPDGVYITDVKVLKVLSTGLDYTVSEVPSNVHFLDNRPVDSVSDKLLFAFTDNAVWKVVLDNVEIQDEIKALLGITDADINSFSMV